MISDYLPNIGYIIEDVPTELFQSLKIECEKANKSRYNSSVQKEVMYSGLTSRGVTKHYYIEENLYHLNKFVLDMSIAYCKEYPEYVSNIKILSDPVPFYATKSWINIQEKTEYLPNHTHDGIFSYVIWVKIPYDLNQEVKNKSDTTSKIQFMYANILGNIVDFSLPIDSSYEGKIMMFPSLLSHCVYPFYTSNENRISISGNIALDTSKYATTEGESETRTDDTKEPN